MNKIISRKEARSRGLIRYFTGKACKRGHIVERYVSDARCIKCAQERVFENVAKWRKRNPLWYEKDRERYCRNAMKWAKGNRAKRQMADAKRRAIRVNATPNWADNDAILDIYQEAQRLTEETGIPHHVDHIIPLQGENVCGLHVENNLRVIPASKNLSKSNKMLAVFVSQPL